MVSSPITVYPDRNYCMLHDLFHKETGTVCEEKYMMTRTNEGHPWPKIKFYDPSIFLFSRWQDSLVFQGLTNWVGF